MFKAIARAWANYNRDCEATLRGKGVQFATRELNRSQDRATMAQGLRDLVFIARADDRYTAFDEGVEMVLAREARENAAREFVRPR